MPIIDADNNHQIDTDAGGMCLFCGCTTGEEAFTQQCQKGALSDPHAQLLNQWREMHKGEKVGQDRALAQLEAGKAAQTTEEAGSWRGVRCPSCTQVVKGTDLAANIGHRCTGGKVVSNDRLQGLEWFRFLAGHKFAAPMRMDQAEPAGRNPDFDGMFVEQAWTPSGNTAPMPPESDRSWMKLWKCHKTVRAERIQAISVLGNHAETRKRPHLALECGVTISVSRRWFDRHNPEEGGFVVVYDDGFFSYSPPDAFLKGYWLLSGSAGTAAHNWHGHPLEHAMVLLSNAEADKSLPPGAAEQWHDSLADWLRTYHTHYKGQEPRHLSPPPTSTAQLKTAATVPNTGPEALRNRFSYHAPKGDQTQRYESIRAGCLELALNIVALTPGSPEQSLALNALDQVMFLANAAIARRE